MWSWCPCCVLFILSLLSVNNLIIFVFFSFVVYIWMRTFKEMTAHYEGILDIFIPQYYKITLSYFSLSVTFSKILYCLKILNYTPRFRLAKLENNLFSVLSSIPDLHMESRNCRNIKVGCQALLVWLVSLTREKLHFNQRSLIRLGRGLTTWKLKADQTCCMNSGQTGPSCNGWIKW